MPTLAEAIATAAAVLGRTLLSWAGTPAVGRRCAIGLGVPGDPANRQARRGAQGRAFGISGGGIANRRHS